ncbi:MAG: 23S rRNA (pseudouridine(1915)-N(3))-methyltransferase RlmH [Clostridia bacterium]|nr:23S rRNA (pseudouridine(1915)-N(3))-methyltransferase RlmH [Clostridia bacterium]
MFEINLVCVGTLHEGYWQQACAEYVKRLTGRCRLTVTEITEQRLPSAPSPAQIAAGLDAEASKILPLLERSAFCAALCVEGGQLSSQLLAQRLSELMVHGTSSASFVIGGSFGLSQRVKQRADLLLSMSDMTFPHQLARVMLCEQLYRAFTILGGEKYHK